jgi:uncharacterized protein YqeY
MLKARLQDDLKAAMKAGNASERDAIRLLLAEFTKAEKAEGSELDPAKEAQVVSRMVKQTRGSIEEYQKFGQADTVAKLEAELALYRRYAPEELSEDTVRAIVKEADSVSGAAGPQDMGKVMKLVMPRVQGKADGGLVQRLVKEALTP